MSNSDKDKEHHGGQVGKDARVIASKKSSKFDKSKSCKGLNNHKKKEH